MPILDPEWQAPIADDRKLPPEVPVAVTLNGEGFAVFMATPRDLEDFAVGFAISETIVSGIQDVQGLTLHEHGKEGISVNLDIDDEQFFTAIKRKRLLTGTSGCGLCGLIVSALPYARSRHCLGNLLLKRRASAPRLRLCSPSKRSMASMVVACMRLPCAAGIKFWRCGKILAVTMLWTRHLAQARGVVNRLIW